ncbi:MAG TPA: nitroreductase family protein [Candidatus Limnocylindrales bacterium]|nr:nitroreductase family protein [Candidatus Limnocylindrales bacterium]
MHKPATTDHPVQELIRERWSPRAFSEKPIRPEVLRSLFEAARWAPSSNNEQPWAFLVATQEDQEFHARMLSTLVEFNQAWAKHAPVLAIAVSELTFARTGDANRNAFYDTGAAVANLSAEATARGLFVHQMAGFNPQKAIELFQIPKGWEPIAALVIGYPGDPQSLPENLRQRELAPRSRKPLSDFVMSGTWGHPAAFLKS